GVVAEIVAFVENLQMAFQGIRLRALHARHELLKFLGGSRRSGAYREPGDGQARDEESTQNRFERFFWHRPFLLVGALLKAASKAAAVEVLRRSDSLNERRSGGGRRTNTDLNPFPRRIAGGRRK